MPIGKKSPPLIESLALLARDRAVHIHIGVAARDVGDPRNLVTFQFTPANQEDKRVEHFTFDVQPMNPHTSIGLWSLILEHADRIAPNGRVIRLA